MADEGHNDTAFSAFDGLRIRTGADGPRQPDRCAQYLPGSGEPGHGDMSLKQFKARHQELYKEHNIEWVSDLVRLGQLDCWRILKKPPYQGDCEDGCLTILNWLLDDGVSEDALFILRVATEVCPPGNVFDHAVLGYLEGGQWFISDNRFENYPAMKMTDFRGYHFFDAVSVANLRGEGSPKLFEEN